MVKERKVNEQISQQLCVLYGRHRTKKETFLEKYKNIYQLGKGKKISDITINTYIFNITWLPLSQQVQQQVLVSVNFVDRIV